MSEPAALSAVAHDLFVAHPPVGARRLRRLFQLPATVVEARGREPQDA